MKVSFKALRIVTISWIILAVMAASGFSGMVLCLGADGHFAFEMTHQGHCQDTEGGSDYGRHGVDELAASENADCCGGCVDMSLSSDIMSQSPTQVMHSLSLMNDLSQFFSTAPCRIDMGGETDLSASRALRSASLRVYPSILMLRTIILRI